MKIDVRLLAIILLCVFALSVVGCFLRRDQDEDEPDDVIASVVSVNPASGSTISPDATITFTFDNPPTDVTASHGVAIVAGKNATIHGPFTTGALVLTLTWGDGSYTVNYTVSAPEPDEPDPESEPELDVDTEPPKIIDSTVSDGDTDVDPDPINNVSKIEFLFSEEVTGTLTLQTENGDDVGWVGEVKGDKGTLQLVKGRELAYETAYIIAARVADAAGNEVNVKIRFTTASNPDVRSPIFIRYILPGRTGVEVDIETINNAGRIELIFNEEVTGDIALYTEADVNVGWLGKVEGNSATLELVKGRELRPETKYTIRYKVSDAAGNKTEDSLFFETTGGPPPPLEGMVLIPAGEFQMGSNDVVIIDGAEGFFPAERPVHAVHVDAFYIDKHEVTNAKYKKFILANPEWQKDKIERRFHDDDYLFDWNGNNHPLGKADHPVTDVSWYAAMAYAKWAGKRLPTEAEWEKAARGGLRQQKYPWGNTVDKNKANYGKNVGGTTPVGLYPPNDYGLHDMMGNVWEWCLDKWDPDFYKDSPRNNPISGGPLMDITNNFTKIITQRVIRGGSYVFAAIRARVANRGPEVPLQTTPDIGFRCALSP